MMAMHRFVVMPFGLCPHCNREWQIDDWYELANGDTLTCPLCDKTIVLDDKDVKTTFTMRLEDE